MNLLNLQSKICLITGGSRGIGYSIAHLYASHGAKVIICGKDPERINIAGLSLKKEFGDNSIHYFQCDVSNELEVKNLFKKIFNLPEKRLDVMVCNAGVLDDALIGMVSKSQIEKVFSINTFGILYCCQYASRLMGRSKKGGSIINISSIIGTNGNEGQAVYSGSKAAVIGITKSLSKELAAQNIRVNAIAPGFIDTEMTRSLDEKKYNERISSIKLSRVGTPLDIAKSSLFFASDISNYVTGQILGVDGGMNI
tara:strand:- start:21701 stop:22462 length:762 start_codon:yes stop_codon:yes gene_type:complete